MTLQTEKFLIQLRASSGKPKPHNRTVSLRGQTWDIEWSTHVEIPMEIDYFNITIGRYLKSESESDENAQKKIEEYWRVTRIPQANRKITYGVNPAEATSIPAKPLEDGIYVIKITGMTNLAAGLEVMTAVGLAIVKLSTQVTPEDQPDEIAFTENTAEPKTTKTPAIEQKPAGPISVTGKTISKILDVLEDEEDDQNTI